MSHVIPFKGGPPDPPDHIISQSPLRLRWGDWRTRSVIQVHVQSAAIYEDYRQECLERGADPSGQMPSHFDLDQGMHQTALALLRHRQDPEALVEVGYLAALMEALLNAPCPVLRTDLIRRVYQEVEELSRRLGLRYGGQVGRFMLPLGEDTRDPDFLNRSLAHIDNLQDFFNTLKEMAQRRFQLLAKGYVLYYPRRISL